MTTFDSRAADHVMKFPRPSPSLRVIKTGGIEGLLGMRLMKSWAGGLGMNFAKFIVDTRSLVVHETLEDEQYVVIHRLISLVCISTVLYCVSMWTCLCILVRCPSFANFEVVPINIAVYSTSWRFELWKCSTLTHLYAQVQVTPLSWRHLLVK